MLRAAALLLALASPLAAGAAEAPIPPAPRARVTDGVGFLSAGARAALELRLARHEEATGQQVLVWIGDTTGDRPIEDFAVRAFEAWGVGRGKQDDGAVLFVFAGDRKARIEVGYGLEGDLTDVESSRILADQLAPRLQAGDRDGAISAAVDAMLAQVGGASDAVASGRGPRPPPRELSWPMKIVLGLLVLGFLVLLVTNPQLALWMLIQVARSSARGGGGWSGGGGWHGGGGRSGGGGASGGW